MTLPTFLKELSMSKNMPRISGGTTSTMYTLLVTNDREIPAKALDVYIRTISKVSVCAMELWLKDMTINDADLNMHAIFSTFKGPRCCCNLPVRPEKAKTNATPLSIEPNEQVRERGLVLK